MSGAMSGPVSGAANLRRRAMAGERLAGGMIFEFFSPGVAQIMAEAGCEYVIYDMEHSGQGLESLKAQVAACRGIGVTPMARPPSSDYHFLARALDIGMKGLMIPMVESAEQARAIAEATRYPPVGRRGAAFGFAHDGYAPGAPADKIAAANEEVLIIAQVETERGLAAVDGIAAVEGIDVLWIGQFDLTNFLGVPGDFESREYREAVDAVAAAAKRHGKGLGIMAMDPEWAEDYAARGFNMIAAGTDPGLLMAGVKGILAGTVR